MLFQAMRILAVIPVYNPDISLLVKCIKSFESGVESIILWRNSPLDPFQLEGYGLAGKLHLAGEGANEGVSKAYNYALEYAREGGFDAIFTMDQDSVWEGFDRFVAKIEGPSAPTGFYGPGVNDRAFNGSFREALTLISSGTLIPLEVALKAGGWNEDFKVDGIDNDFFFRCRELGIRGWEVGDCVLHHQLGRVEFKRFAGIRFRTYNYSPERLYGIYRNNLIVIKKYSGTREFGRAFRRNWFWRKPIRILLGEREVCAKFKAICRGVRDAGRYKP